MSKATARPSVWVAVILATLMVSAGCGDSNGASSSPDVQNSTISPTTAPPATQTNSSAPHPAHGVVGTITSADGQPVSGAMVQPAPGPGNDAPEREVFARSAADGTYGIDLSPGDWELTISADGYQPAVVHVTVPETGTVQANVELAPAD